MLLDQVTDTQIKAAQIFVGATFAAFLAATVFRHQAQRIRLAITAVYLIGVVCFIAYELF